MKKGSRFLRGLKKLLCCCWCKAQQQDEEAHEYVVVEPPRQDEGEKPDDHFGDGPVTGCDVRPQCESAQSLSEEFVVLEDPVPEAEQVVFIDESLIGKPLEPAATEAPECIEQQGKSDRQTEHCGARRRRRRKKRKKVQRKEEDDGGEWHLVCKKPRRKKNETVGTPAAITPCKPEPHSVSRQPKEPRRGNKCHRQEEERDRVRLSWQDSTVKVVVPVPPNRRRHVIGTRGDTIRQLQQQYPAVRVSVPLPQDLTSREVTVEGPKTQADAVAQQIIRRLQAIEEKLREAEQRRQENKKVVIKVEVPSDMRRHVVGPRGEVLRRLSQEHLTVMVKVPPRSDNRTREAPGDRSPKQQEKRQGYPVNMSYYQLRLIVLTRFCFLADRGGAQLSSHHHHYRYNNTCDVAVVTLSSADNRLLIPSLLSNTCEAPRDRCYAGGSVTPLSNSPLFSSARRDQGSDGSGGTPGEAMVGVSPASPGHIESH
ncbi:Vigilin [Portunus trituberculatus]|uniref:Vigilin n=1 Tax=Portunus trituberculatus TaxID=210409 RepID=A0A5B7DWV5_PORTR|nr:Vigilin [Portunus trituberculatus]